MSYIEQRFIGTVVVALIASGCSGATSHAEMDTRAASQEQVTCDERAESALEEVLAALKNADHQCTADSDCVLIKTPMRCNHPCLYEDSVHRSASSLVIEEIEDVDARLCEGFDAVGESGCQTQVPSSTSCAAKKSAACVAGNCQLR